MTDEEFKGYLDRRQARIYERAQKQSNKLIDDFLRKNDARALVHEMEGQKSRKKKLKKRRGTGKCGNR